MSEWRHDALGYLASALVLATFSMTSMVWLRVAAIASNIAFISYALSTGARPILILHSLLLPMNIWHLFQLELFHSGQKRARRQEGDVLY